ncbi:hypothetical protein TNCT_20771 [Trichonephila clavata]|uniref:Uncharacterized protein n=1 Tax=Trichonephila clavata TaxID=2740835 RepID=A0A8X6K7J8_TRICU|nr:hypothetical protein TNCT_20771 [Trichonephila clavata]
MDGAPASSPYPALSLTSILRERSRRVAAESVRSQARTRLEPPPVQILVVVANIRVRTSKTEARRRVPCEQQLNMGESVLIHFLMEYLRLLLFEMRSIGEWEKG